MSSQKAVNLSAIILCTCSLPWGNVILYKPSQMWDRMTQEDPFFFSRDPSTCAVVHSPSCCSTGSEKQGLNENQCHPGAQHGPIYPGWLHPLLLSPAVPWQVAVSTQAHHLTVPVGPSALLRAAGRDGAEMETNTEGWVLHTDCTHDWRRRVHPQFCSTPLLASSGDILAFPWHCSAEYGSCPVIPVWWHDSTMVWGTISWAFFGPPGPALHVPTTPLIDARVGTITWMLQHWQGKWAGTGSFSCAVPSADQILFFPAKEVAWAEAACMREGTWGTLDPDRNWMRRKKAEEDLPMPLTGTPVSAVKFPEMKNIQQAKSALAFSLSGKGIKNV